MSEQKQTALNEIELEIARELNLPEALGYEPPAEPNEIMQEMQRAAKTVSRKPYRLTDFDAPRDKEMAVFTHAKKLSEYIFVICEKSPKKFRWSIITRLQNASVEVVEHLYRANFERDNDKRLDYQKSAAVALKLIDFYAETARKKQAITIRQTAIIAKQIAETDKLLVGWVKSTKRNK